MSAHFFTSTQCQIPCCYTYRLLSAGATQGELPEGQEKPHWGAPPCNPSAHYFTAGSISIFYSQLLLRIRKKHRFRGAFSLSIKSIYRFYFSCGSTHSIEFAQQIHKFREHVSRNLYKGRKNVSAGRGFSSRFARKRGFEREAVRKTKFFDSLRGTPFGVPHFIFRRYSFCRR